MSISLHKKVVPMMQLHTTVEEEEKVIKRALYDGMRTAKVKQEIVASVLELDQSSVSRMTNPNEERQISVAHLSMLAKDPYTVPVAEAVLAALGAAFILPESQANGSAIDELIELTKEDGKLAAIIGDGIQKNEVKDIREIAKNLSAIADRLHAEADHAERGK